MVMVVLLLDLVGLPTRRLVVFVADERPLVQVAVLGVATEMTAGDEHTRVASLMRVNGLLAIMICLLQLHRLAMQVLVLAVQV